MRILKEPLLHFAVLGIGLFALYRLVSGGAASDPDEIVVDSPRIAALAEEFERPGGVRRRRAEIDGLVESYVRDEVLYREGLALGLDRDDPVIRSRVRLKMEVLSDGAKSAVTRRGSAGWFDGNADRYATPTRYDVRQVYFDPARPARARAPTSRRALHELGARARDSIRARSAIRPCCPAVLERRDSRRMSPRSSATSSRQRSRTHRPALVRSRELVVRRASAACRFAATPPKAAVLADVRDVVERDVRYSRAQMARDALYAALARSLHRAHRTSRR